MLVWVEVFVDCDRAEWYGAKLVRCGVYLGYLVF